MRNQAIIFLLFVVSTSTFSQEIKFKNTDQKLVLKKGDLVHIQADSAYLISKSRALLLNEKLDELESARVLNSNLHTINEDLLSKIKEVEKLVEKLLKRMETDADNSNVDLEQILIDLDKNLVSLKQNNSELAKNNHDLEIQIDDMDDTIQKLKQEIRGIWWNGITDKIVVGVLGIGIGLLIGSA